MAFLIRAPEAALLAHSAQQNIDLENHGFTATTNDTPWRFTE